MSFLENYLPKLKRVFFNYINLCLYIFIFIYIYIHIFVYIKIFIQLYTINLLSNRGKEIKEFQQIYVRVIRPTYFHPILDMLIIFKLNVTRANVQQVITLQFGISLRTAIYLIILIVFIQIKY